MLCQDFEIVLQWYRIERCWRRKRSQKSLPPPFLSRATNATTMCRVATLRQSLESTAPSGLISVEPNAMGVFVDPTGIRGEQYRRKRQHH